MKAADLKMRADRMAETLGPSVEALYLFGSHASGRDHRQSDVDLAVLLDAGSLPTRRLRFEEGLRLRARLVALLHEDRLDLVVLNDLPTPFARRILKEGVALHLANPAGARGFERDVQLRAPDVERFLARHRRRKLAALAR